MVLNMMHSKNIKHNSETNDTLSIYVIVITFNMLNGLRGTLESIRAAALANNYFCFNVIIINGNTNDAGHTIASEYEDLIYKYVAEADNGIYDAMNKGISLLPDDGYAIFINSDDDLINIPMSLINSNCDVGFCNVLSHDIASGLKEIFRVNPQDRISASNLLRPRLHHQGCIAKNFILKKYRYDLTVGIRADVLLMGTLLKNHNAKFFNDEVALIKTGGKSDTYNLNNLASFFKIAKNLGINPIFTFILSIPEITKYVLKGVIGHRGVNLVRILKHKMQIRNFN